MFHASIKSFRNLVIFPEIWLSLDSMVCSMQHFSCTLLSRRRAATAVKLPVHLLVHEFVVKEANQKDNYLPLLAAMLGNKDLFIHSWSSCTCDFRVENKEFSRERKPLDYN